ncbi:MULTISPECIES: hypothetical protein [unclassified Lacrimispora]|uniref:hypothetical protein n=1 Tax=unclassified Lacrimispora TaxID=2719232 RepID=UPI00376FA492
MENKNVFEETVETLIKDANKLQTKFSKCQENNNFTEALSCMRLLKDTLSLIKEYDWELKYAEHETTTGKQLKIWEQNHCGEIRNLKEYYTCDSIDKKNVWIEKFESCIANRKSYICTYGDECRGTGKSYALASLCNKYNGIVVSEKTNGLYGIKNNCKQFGFNVLIYSYRDVLSLRQAKNRILFLDEFSGLSYEQIDKLKESHVVIGFN